MTALLTWGGLILIALIVNYRHWVIFPDNESEENKIDNHLN